MKLAKPDDGDLIVGMIFAAFFMWFCWPSHAYDLKNLSGQDLLVIGKGLQELPRKETSTDDGKGLWERVQAQITAQEQAVKKASDDANAKTIADYRANLTFELINERGWPTLAHDGDR